MAEELYSPNQELHDTSSAIGSALMARFGPGMTDLHFRNCCMGLATETCRQRRLAFERLQRVRISDRATRISLDQQHRQWVSALLFGAVMHRDFRPDVPAKFEEIVRAILNKVETTMVFFPDVFA
jgi:hypothetical protein